MSDDFTTWCPTPPLSTSNRWRMQIAQYGDGYRQAMLDGINALDQTFSVSFDTRPQKDIEAMNLYLVNNKNKMFGFRYPTTGTILQVFCDEWDIEWNLVKWDASGNRTVYGTLSADFIRANGVMS
jgi:phage-related protein